MTAPAFAPAERRILLRLLRLALGGPLSFRPGTGALVCLEGAAGVLKDVPAAVLRRAVAEGLLRRDGTALSASEGTATYLRRALAEPQEEAFAEQHRDTMGDVVVEDGIRHAVRRNLAESPLSALSRLKDREGRPWLSEEAFAAGERLAADFERGGLQPRITATWEPRLSSRVPGAAPAAVTLGDAALGARMRVTAAIEALGPELSGVALDICCFMKGLETVERERQWPARSAKLMLRTALLALARHYAPPPPVARRRHAWGSEGYRPEIG